MSAGRPRQTVRSPMAYAVGLLSRREYSQQELRSRLQAKEVSPEEVERILARVAELGIQSDQRFVQSQTRMLRRTTGDRGIVCRLQRKVSVDLLESELAEGEGEVARLVALLSKEVGKNQNLLTDAKSLLRWKTKMARKGFSFENISLAVREAERE